MAASAAAVLLAVSMSGCFLFSSLKWSSVRAKPGKSVDALIAMIPETGNIADKDYPFFMIGAANTSDLSLAGIGKRTWDVKEKFNGPRPLQEDGSIESAALNSDNCNLNGIELTQITEVQWTAVRTDVQVNDRDRAGVVAQSRIRFKVDSGATARDEQVYVFAGGWRDELTADGIAQPEEVSCSGGTISALSIAG